VKVDRSPIANKWGYGVGGVWMGWNLEALPHSSFISTESEIITQDFRPYSAINYVTQSAFSL